MSEKITTKKKAATKKKSATKKKAATKKAGAPATDLMVFEDVNPKELFAGTGERLPINNMIEKITKFVKSVVYDATTKEGRKNIASMAAKVASAKVKLDTIGKDYNAERKKVTAAIDGDRRALKDALQALQDEIREPLTEWERQQAEEEQAIQDRLADIKCLTNDLHDMTVLQLNERAEQAQIVVVDDTLGAYRGDAEMELEAAIEEIAHKIVTRQKADDDAAELELLRKKQADEAAAQAAQKTADAALQKKASDAVEAQQKAEQVALDAKQAEIDAIAAADEKAAQAVRDEQQRVASANAEAVRIKIAKEAAAAAAEKEKSENKAHRAKVNIGAMEGLIEHAKLSKEQAQAVVIAVVQKKIPAVTLKY